MREYFNAKERTEHIILLAAQDTVENLSSSTALTKEEAKELRTALKAIKKFNELTFVRLGEPYRRKILLTMKDNDLRLVGKGAKFTECISHAATEDLAPAINELRMLNCLTCEKTNHKDCAIYSICVACDVEASESNGDCPFGI